MAKLTINEMVPTGKRLLVRDAQGRKFGYHNAGRHKVEYPEGFTKTLADAPAPRPAPEPRTISTFDDLTAEEKVDGLLETLSAAQKSKIVTATRAKHPARTAPVAE